MRRQTWAVLLAAVVAAARAAAPPSPQAAPSAAGASGAAPLLPRLTAAASGPPPQQQQQQQQPLPSPTFTTSLAGNDPEGLAIAARLFAAPDPRRNATLQALGRMLATQCMQLTEAAGRSSGNATFLKPLFSPAYQILRADGVRQVPSTYTPPDLLSYEVSDVVATAPTPDVLVVRYNVTAVESVNGRQLSSGWRPRLTVFARGTDGGGSPTDSTWRIVSQASMNEPTEPECAEGDIVDPVPPAGPAAELGAAVMRDWQVHVTQGTPLRAVNPMIQVQMANGSGFSTAKELEHISAQAIQGVSNLVATRAGRLLVLSYNVTTDTVKRPRPHLTVLLEDGGPLAGNWSMIAQANFNNPKLAPTDPLCAGKSGSSAGCGRAIWGGCQGPGRPPPGGAAAARLATAGAALLLLQALVPGAP